MKLIEDTYRALSDIVKINPERFSGIGLVVYDSTTFDTKSHSDLRPSYQAPDYDVTSDVFCQYLAEISDYRNAFHDGFHMVDETGRLRYVAQYFVPPVVAALYPNQEHGVRLHSARCGSTLPGVIFIAVISSNFEIHLFQHGETVDLAALEGACYAS
ncbi:hypothetical protein EBJ67_16040 [Salmonella enterica subsp. enterica serovar Bovismorbificans]|nr:hypothetical protein [Salmonella enterica subsp. enterica serovar Bovismorbificans]